MPNSNVPGGYYNPDGTGPANIGLAAALLEPSTLIELFELDATAIGDGEILYLYGSTNIKGNSIVWDGQVYQPFPFEATGFEQSTEGKMARPKIKVANVTGMIGALNIDYGDLVGAKLIRRRTLARYLDAVNFPDGNPGADPSQLFSEDTWQINQKTLETSIYVEFELTAVADVQGFKIPNRKIMGAYCPFRFKNVEDGCSFSGPAASCEHTLEYCKYLHTVGDVTGPLPFGGFPGTTRL